MKEEPVPEMMSQGPPMQQPSIMQQGPSMQQSSGAPVANMGVGPSPMSMMGQPAVRDDTIDEMKEEM